MNYSPDTALVLSRVGVRADNGRNRREFALEDVSLSVAKGEFVSIVDPSGIGTSTLMRVILGLMPPARGDIMRGFETPAMVPRDHALFPWLTVLENVAFGLQMKDVPQETREHVAREKLAEVNLEHIEQRYPAVLSREERQRVSLARALTLAPDLLIMDEPFSGLDTIAAAALKADLLRIWRSHSMTILMTNSLIPEAVELSDRVVLMEAHPGRIATTLTINLPRPRDPRSPAFFREVDRLTNAIRRIS